MSLSEEEQIIDEIAQSLAHISDSLDRASVMVARSTATLRRINTQLDSIKAGCISIIVLCALWIVSLGAIASATGFFKGAS